MTAPDARLTLADRIEYSVKTDGWYCAYKEQGDLIIDALRAQPGTISREALVAARSDLMRLAVDGDSFGKTISLIDTALSALPIKEPLP